MMSNYRLMMTRCRRQSSQLQHKTLISSSSITTSSPLIKILPCSSSSYYHTTSKLLQSSRNNNNSRVVGINNNKSLLRKHNNNNNNNNRAPSSSHYRNHPNRPNRTNYHHNHQGQTVVRIDYIPPSSSQDQQPIPPSSSTTTTTTKTNTKSSNILQTCLTSLNNSFKPPDHHSNFNICFLGTGGNMPSPTRNTSSTILSLGSQSFVFDVGEGTQRQLLFSRLSSTDICKIFITHMHGDHVLGLISLLLQIDLYAVQQKQQQQKQTKGRKEMMMKKKSDTVVELYGPPGLYGFIKSQLLFIESKLKMTLIVHELMGSKAGRKQCRRHYDNDEDIDWEYIGTGNGAGSAGNRHLKIHRRELYPDNNTNHDTDNDEDDFTWTISQPELTRDMITNPQKTNNNNNNNIPGHHHRRSVLPNDYHAGPYRQYHIHAAEIHHNPGLPTFGYVVKEMTPPQKIDPHKAIKCGVMPSFKYHLLKNGFSVRSDDDEEREVRPEDVLLMDDESSGAGGGGGGSRARKLVVLGDNCGVSKGMVRIGRHADVLVTEATVEEDYRERDAIYRGHSTGAMAGRLARQLKAKTVFLNHFGGGSNMNSLQQLRHSVDIHCNTSTGDRGGVGIGESAKDNNCMVVTAHDFMEVVVPYGGFGDDDDDDEHVIC